MAVIDGMSINGNAYDLRDKVAVRFNEAQTLTDAQKAIGRGNIDAVALKQGAANAGKVLLVGEDGNVTTGAVGVSNAVKTALLACFERVMWIDDSGQSAYEDLYNALYNNKPVIPKYDFRKMNYDIGGLGPENIYEWANNTRTRTGHRMVEIKTLTNRVNMRSYMPAVSGTINAMSGYEICVYMFYSIQFASQWYYDPKTDTRNKFGVSGGLNIDWIDAQQQAQIPQWCTSFTIENPDCKYIWLAFRKTDNSDWTQDELQNMYGTVFTASLSPSYKLFDIAEYEGGYSYTNGNRVKDEKITEADGYMQYPIYVAKTAVSARAIMEMLPVTKGIFRSADTSKYQICLYQINSIGAVLVDIGNPYISESNHWPAWADEFNLANSVHKDDIFCICISFKKLDGTDFTQEELSNMYGTVFTYEEV